MASWPRRGVVVPYRTLHRFAVERCGYARRPATLRVADGEPGVECQIDFGRLGLIPDRVTGRRRVTHGLIFTAVYSRHMFVWLTFSQTLTAVIAGCEAAWAYFGGIFPVLIPDNLSPVVTDADTVNPTFSAGWLDYAQARGFGTDPARVRRPQDKPRVERSQPVLPMMPGMPEKRTHDYVRHGVTSLFAAFNTADGTVISSLHRRHRAIEFKKFLIKIDQQVPEHLDVHLVCDNYGTHKTPAITAWLARHPRFHMHFTPTSSSWINQVERWFAYVTDELIRRGNHTSVQALENDIRGWVADWNTDPKPFIWTKTAEQILESLGRLITRINGEGH